MSRIGNKIITVPEGVTVEIADDNTVTVTGSKGTLVKQFSPAISFKQEGNEITVVRSSEEKHVKQLHGTTRALLANMIEGVHNGYSKTLEIVGIGYRGQMNLIKEKVSNIVMKESSEKKEKLLVRSSLRVRKELSLWLNYNLVMMYV